MLKLDIHFASCRTWSEQTGATMSQNLLRFIIRHKSSTGGNMVRCRGVAWGLDGVRTRGRKVVAHMRRRLNLEGFGGMLPQKMFKFRVSEMPFPAFSTRYFQLINTQEKSSSQLFVLPIPSVVCKVECLQEKKASDAIRLWNNQKLIKKILTQRYQYI